MEMMGIKLLPDKLLNKQGVPVIPGSNDAVQSVDEIKLLSKIGFPVVLKAASGGGGKEHQNC